MEENDAGNEEDVDVEEDAVVEDDTVVSSRRPHFEVAVVKEVTVIEKRAIIKEQTRPVAQNHGTSSMIFLLVCFVAWGFLMCE